MKIKLLLLSTLLLFFACKKEETIPLLSGELATIEEIKASLSEASNNSNLVIGIESLLENEISYRKVNFEDETNLIFKAQLLDTVEVVEQSWQAKFTFSDGCEQLAAHLGSLQIHPDSIHPNPFGTAPLTALINIEMPVKGKFSIKVLGKGADGLAISNDFTPFENTHELPILGLYSDYNNEVELSFKSVDDKIRATTIVNIQTEATTILSNVRAYKNELPPGEQSIYFITEINAGMDLQNEIRWYYTGDAFYTFRKTRNGNLIVSGAQGRTHYHCPRFYEVSMLGEIINTYEVPNMQHHEIIELPSGNFLVATNSTFYDGNRNDGNLEEDMIIEMDRQTRNIVKSWDLNQILDNSRPYPGSSSDPDDWMHLNSLFFDATDNSIVLSGKHQCTVAKIDYETGDLIWILAHPAGWSSPQKEALLTPVDAQGQAIDLTTMDFLPYYQHNAMLLPDGNLYLYDNGNYRGYFDDNSAPWQGYTRAAEYKINEAQQTVELVWTYGYVPSIFTAATGDVDFNPENGHRLIGYMLGSSNSPKILELDENKEVILDININAGKSYYRFEKMALY